MTPRELQGLTARMSAACGGDVTNEALLDTFARAVRVTRDLVDDPGNPLLRNLRADPQFVRLLACDDALGQLHQSLNEPALAAAYRAAARGRHKFTDAQAIAATQLFTPRWVVEYLLHNTLGRRWIAAHPDSGIRSELTWLVRSDEPAGGPESLRHKVRDLRVLDPACGAMNFGLVAIDLLRAMYREEIGRAGRPGWPASPSVRSERDVDASILRNNLFGIDLDPAVLDLARTSLGLKVGRDLGRADCNLRQADALADAIGRDGWPAAYDVVVTNPPYLARRNLPAGRLRQLKSAQPAARGDTCAAFLLRCLDLLNGGGGRAGVLAMQSFMFTGSFDRLRADLTGRAAVESIAHFGPGLFGVGNPGTLQTAAVVLRREADAARRDGQRIDAFRLTGEPDAAAKRHRLARLIEDVERLTPSPPNSGERAGVRGRASSGVDRALPVRASVCLSGEQSESCVATSGIPFDAASTSHVHRAIAPYPYPLPEVPGRGGEDVQGRYTLRQSDLASLPRGAWAYWTCPALRQAFATFPRLRSIAPPRQGLATTDNARFVRYWWEVDPVGVDPAALATPGRWSPYAKGGRFRRWYEAPRHRVNWEEDGREIKAEVVRRYPYLGGRWEWVAKNASYYGRGGVTYSYLTSGRFSARLLGRGAIFDVAGSSLFPDDALTALAVLNSSAAAALLGVINPTVNFQVGDLAELPVPPRSSDGLRERVRAAIDLQREADAHDETSPDFRAPLSWSDGPDVARDRARRLAALERAIDEEVGEWYGIRGEASTACGAKRGSSHRVPSGSAAGPDPDAAPAIVPAHVARGDDARGRVELARRWVSYAVGLVLGR